MNELGAPSVTFVKAALFPFFSNAKETSADQFCPIASLCTTKTIVFLQRRPYEVRAAEDVLNKIAQEQR